jgi:hypothetical protein
MSPIDRRILLFLRFASIFGVLSHGAEAPDASACAIETESMTNEEAAIKDAASPRPREAAKA